jgi:hypothetical protein
LPFPAARAREGVEPPHFSLLALVVSQKAQKKKAFAVKDAAFDDISFDVLDQVEHSSKVQQTLHLAIEHRDEH